MDFEICELTNSSFFDKRQGGGSFSYDVAVGTVLPLGEYPVSVTFTPEHPHRYTTVTVKSTLRVLRPREPTLHWPELEEIRYPAPLGRIELCVRVSSLNCTDAVAPLRSQ